MTSYSAEWAVEPTSALTLKLDFSTSDNTQVLEPATATDGLTVDVPLNGGEKT